MLSRRFVMWLTVVAAIGIAGFLIMSPAQAQKEKAAEVTMSTYLVISPHTMEECLASLDGIVATGEGALDNWYWGCAAGDHTGYLIVEAESEAAALAAVPENIREKARAMKLNKFTEEQVATFHEKMK
jgi:hypothetical protein